MSDSTERVMTTAGDGRVVIETDADTALLFTRALRGFAHLDPELSITEIQMLSSGITSIEAEIEGAEND